MTTLVKWSPARELDLMERRMLRLLEGFGTVPAFWPAADVYETEDELVVELEVPGFAEKELAIEAIDHTIEIKGERSEPEAEIDKVFRLHERLPQRFERRFELPHQVDASRLTAVFANGVLEVHAPKTKETKPRQIAIGKK